MFNRKMLKFIASNTTGAFSDGAILFPLLILLHLQAGMSGPILLATAGSVYIFSVFFFRIPMAVQPLKSLVISALTLGASINEIRTSTALFGVFCLSLTLFNISSLLSKVPRHMIHGLQMGLGIVLISKGLGDFFHDQGYHNLGPGVGLSLLVILVMHFSGKPIIGWVAVFGLIWSLWKSFSDSLPSTPIFEPKETLRFDVILALILPQIILTLANSVVATQDVAKRYFKDQASRITTSRLLYSIGFGNILAGLIGGLPFCHGAGGLTAHAKGGSTHYISNVIIGSVLIIFGILSINGAPIFPAYPKLITSILMIVAGWFHLGLAKASLVDSKYAVQLLSMACTALLTQNMLWILAMGSLFEGYRLLMRKKEKTA